MSSASLRPILSVVIPLFDEGRVIQGNAMRVVDYLATLEIDYEVVLVDDGSTDDTAAVCQCMTDVCPSLRMVGHPKNQGKGAAVRTGVLTATGEYVIFLDADLAVPPEYIGKCFKRLKTNGEIVIGSRHLPDSHFHVREGVARQILGEAFRRFARSSLGLKVSDVTCGLKGFPGPIAKEIFSRSKIRRWGYDAEILFIAQRLGYSIAEIPVEWTHSFDSKVRLGVDMVRTLTELFRIRYYYLTAKYHMPFHVDHYLSCRNV